LNTATKEQLMSLPGISAKIADGIIADRPYSRPADVLQRRLVTKAEYDAIADRIVTN
jgi:DNA uptake protein ComE-like DNA-binding protein